MLWGGPSTRKNVKPPQRTSVDSAEGQPRALGLCSWGVSGEPQEPSVLGTVMVTVVEMKRPWELVEGRGVAGRAQLQAEVAPFITPQNNGIFSLF